MTATTLRPVCLIGTVLLLVQCSYSVAQEIRPAGELGLTEVAPETPVLILPSDPTAVPTEPLAVQTVPAPWNFGRYPARVGLLRDSPLPLTLLSESPRDGSRLGCGDEGYTIYPYAVADPYASNFVWLDGSTLYGDDLTLVPGTWQIECYDVFIYADNSTAYGCNQNRTVTLRAHSSCNGEVIPGSQESWTVPPHGGPVLLTGVTNVSFTASGTIWFSLTTSINQCDGWYVSHQNLAGSTTVYVQYDSNCFDYIAGQYNKFHVVLYAECFAPTISVQPASGAICPGQSYAFCVTASGSGQLSYQWQNDGSSISGATSSCFSATQAGSYRCLVSNECGSLLSAAATLTVNTPPTIGTQPTGAVICSSQTHEFCITASGTAPLSCRWQLNEVDIEGATAACYPASQAGSYRCRVTNSCGTVFSDAATLTLLTGPTIIAQPVGGIVCGGQPHEMCAAAQGAGLLRYQWRRNGLTIISATGACYSATLPGTYTCVVSDDCGTVVSEGAGVTARGTGDLDGNGDPDMSDVPLFVAVLLGEDTDPARCAAADANCDDENDGGDVQGFVELLLEG